MPDAIIAGLGNPGSFYKKTRHNLGFNVIEAFAKTITHAAWKKDTLFRAEIIHTHFLGKSLILVKPLTYMNHSGEPIAALCRYYKIAAKNLLVIYDDINLELGKVKVAFDEHSGGHNGIKNIFFHLGEIFVRYRLGIGPKLPASSPLENFVLASFSENENKVIEKKMNEILAGLELIIKDGPTLAMNTLNRRPDK